VRRFLIPIGLFLALVVAAPAEAKLVYVRPTPVNPEFGDAGDIVVARDDGSASRVIAHGSHPVISPDGSHVAYFSRPADAHTDRLRIVPARGGRSRLLLRHSFPPGPGAPLAWSHDSHLVAAAGSGPLGTVIDVRSGKRLRTLEFDFQFDGASFSADDSAVVFLNGAERGTTLLLAQLDRKRTRTIATGAGAVWVPAGIFFTNGGIWLLRRPGSRERTVYKGHGSAFLSTVGASEDGRTVLVAEGPTDHDQSPVLIASKSHATLSVPTVLTQVCGLSRHGRFVLGVTDGNVVVAARDGTTRVVATGAISPSWNG
jgi:hypothetical protein